MGAEATAQGNAIRFAPGKFRPDTKEGRELLGHELSHVRTQAEGNVRVNVPGSNINFDQEQESAGDMSGRDFAAGTLSDAVPVAVSGMSAYGAPAQGSWFGRKKTPIHQQSPEKIKAYLQEKLQANNKKSNEGMTQFQKMFPDQKYKVSGPDSIDSRIVGPLGGAMDEKSRKEFFEDYGSFDPKRRKKHVGNYMDKLSGQILNMTPEMAGEDYILNNIDKVMEISNNSTGFDNIKAENPQYEFTKKQKDVFGAAGEGMANYSMMLTFMLGKYGLNQKGEDADVMPQEVSNLMIDQTRNDYLKSLGNVAKVKEQYPNQPQGGFGQGMSKLWSGVKGFGSTAASLAGAGAMAGVNKIGSGLKSGAKALGNLGGNVSKKWNKLRHIFD
jgi:hypothetical protein